MITDSNRGCDTTDEFDSTSPSLFSRINQRARRGGIRACTSGSTRAREGTTVFQQILDPLGNLFATWIVALIPVAALLVMLAVFRVSAWLATLIGSIVTFLLAMLVWHMPLDKGALAYAGG